MTEKTHSPLRIAVEFAVLFSIPLLLIGIHYVTSEAMRASLYFYLADPSLPAAWTGAVVHGSWDHVVGNSVAYLLAIFMIHTIYTRWGKDRLLWILFIVVLLTTPPVQSFFDFLALNVYLGAGDQANTKGFSGVVGAFIGMLMVTIGAYTATRINRTVGNNLTLLIFYFAAAVILAIYTPEGLVVPVAALIFVGIVSAVWYGTANLDVGGIGSLRDHLRAEFEDVAVVCLSVVVVLFLVYLSFPSDPGAGGTTANLIGHLTGIGYGFAVTATAVRVM